MPYGRKQTQEQRVRRTHIETAIGAVAARRHPATTNITPTAVNPSASAHTWGTMTEVLGDATIDAPALSHFVLESARLSALDTSESYYFDIGYGATDTDAEANVVGSGYVGVGTTTRDIVRGRDYWMTPVERVTGRDLYIRTMCSNTSKNASVGPLAWKAASPNE